MSSDNPASAAKKAVGTSTNTAKGETANLELFGQQMWLLDYFANSPHMFGTTWGPAPGAGTAVSQMPTDIFNTLDSIGPRSLAFLEQLLPHEYAQLIPAIQLYIVINENQKHIPIPLLKPNDIAYSVKHAKEGKFYSGHVAGLKSMKMNVDGNTTPLTGKIYNVDLGLIFDSINTFFEKIPGTSQTYADIFKSYGASGGPTSLYKLKMVIQYNSANKELIRKYGLGTADQTYVCHLQFIKSVVKLHEDLRTEVQVRFQGWEEAVLSNNDIFNFLHIDIPTAQKKHDKKLAKLQAALRKIPGAVKEEQAKELKAIRSKITAATVQQAIDATIEKHLISRAPPQFTYTTSRKYVQGDPESGHRNTGPKVTKKHNNPKYAEWKATGELHARVDASTALLQDTNTSSIAEAYQFIAEQYRQGKIIDVSGRAWTGGRGSATHAGGRAQAFDDMLKLVDEIKTSGKKWDTTIKERTNDVQEQVKAAKEHQDHLRLNLTHKALDDLIFSNPFLLISEIEINHVQLIQYINGYKDKKTNYFDKFKIATPGLKKRKKETPKAKQERHMKRSNEISKLQKERDANRRLLRTVRKDIRNYKTFPGEKEKWRQGWEAHDKGLRSAVKQIKEKIKQLDKSIKKKTTKGTVLDKDSFERELKTFQKIKYIPFGPLIESLMVHGVYARCEKVFGHDAIPTKEVKRTSFLLAQIELEKLATTQRDLFGLYYLPISIANLQKIFHDSLVAKLNISMTIMKLIREIIKMVSLAQKKKQMHLGRTNSANNFALQYYTYPLIETGAGLEILRKGAPDPKIKNGVLVFLRNNKQDFTNLNGDLERHRDNLIPNFFLGGQTRGAVKKIELSEKLDEGMAKVAMMRADEHAGGGKVGIMPSLFSVKLVLVGALNFHIGHMFWLSAPTVPMSSSTASWFWLNAYYMVTGVTISYTAGGQLETIIMGQYQWSPRLKSRPAHKKLPPGATATVKMPGSHRVPR